eukprot:gene8766-9703_t
MLQVHRKKLLEKRVELVKDLEPKDITSYLYQKDVLSEDDVELIKSERTRKLRAELFLDTIPRRGPNAYEAFIESLKQNSGTKHLADFLYDDFDITDSGQCISHPKVPKVESSKEATENVDVYSMIHKPHGLCLIINNKTFSGFPDRSGSDVDVQSLQNLFTSMDYNVRKLIDATVSMMQQTIEEISTMDHSTTDCLVVFLMSHGIAGKIYDIHGDLIEVSTLLQPLMYCNKNPVLMQKPRLFFIQACRVPEDSMEKNETNTPSSLPGSAAKSYEVIIHRDSASAAMDEHLDLSAKLFIQDASTPMPANILFSYSTLPGEPSMRHSVKGGWFTEALVDIFQQHASKKDVVSMLTMVNKIVLSRVSSNSAAVQLPVLLNTLTKKLCLSS